MILIKKLKLLLSLNKATILLLLEAYIYLGWARIKKRIPFSKVAPTLGEEMKETSLEPNPSNIKVLKRISHAIHIMSKYTFWESECLVKAMAGMKMLEKRQIESTIYLGTGKDEAGNMIAHAWLRSGPFFLTGLEGKEHFTVIATFAKVKSNDVKGEKNVQQFSLK